MIKFFCLYQIMLFQPLIEIIENSGVKPGDTVIVLGSGPIGLMTQKFAWLKGAERVIAVDNIESRLQHAETTNKVEAPDLKDYKDIGERGLEIPRRVVRMVFGARGLAAAIGRAGNCPD